jgi:hypothetical protein
MCDLVIFSRLVLMVHTGSESSALAKAAGRMRFFEFITI